MLKLGSGKSLNISKWVKKDAGVLFVSSKAPVTCSPEQRIKDIAHILASKYRRLPVMDESGQLRGILSGTDILKLLVGMTKKKRGMRSPADMKVKDVMNHHVVNIDKNMKLEDVIDFFKKHRRGAYPVTYRKKLVGLVSEWDLVRQLRGNTGVRVSDVMVKKPIIAREDFSVADTAKMFAMGGFRRLPVAKGGILIGIVTARDILGFLVRNRLLGKLPEQRQNIGKIIVREVSATTADADIYEAAKVMVSERVGGLPVVEDHELTGILTERDIVDVIEF
ncbi:MAG: CBS domain-containing protein [Candidatus Aenigmarchaeota archaeon]|nr:CBS domain-containing protein [Candidatus Aenigmarchaeota archaeon]